MKFYDGTKLLSMKDINGDKPEIYICTSNRSAGKTTYFGRYCVNRFIRKKEKFILLYRFSHELKGCSNKFFKDINTLFFPNYVMTEKAQAKGAFYELFLNEESCGYAIALNTADNIKKYSHFFSDAARILFDEFQSETGRYCSNEIEKFISIHVSIARGGGSQVRYLPVIMLSNAVSLVNPYYVAMNITGRLRSETRFLKGEGFVLEQGYNESAASAQQESAFNRALSNSSYLAYAAQNVYLNDNTAFIDSPSGKSFYICTVIYKGKEYGIREFTEQGIIYCSDKPDPSCNVRIAATTDDHNINYVILKKNDLILSNLKYYFEKGCFRFKDLTCKELVLTLISYT